MWPMGWCGGRCSSSGTWRCTRVLAATPWRVSEGAGVWRTAPGRRLPHAEVERTHLCQTERDSHPFSQDTSCFFWLSAPLLSFWILAAAQPQRMQFLCACSLCHLMPSLWGSHTSCTCAVCGSRWSRQETVANSTACFFAEVEVWKGFWSTTDPLPSAETSLMPLPVHFWHLVLTCDCRYSHMGTF